MNRWRVRRIYRKATEAYKDGLRDGLATGQERDSLFRPAHSGSPVMAAYTAGRRVGALHVPDAKYPSSPKPVMPTWLWSEVLAEAMRP